MGRLRFAIFGATIASLTGPAIPNATAAVGNWTSAQKPGLVRFGAVDEGLLTLGRPLAASETMRVAAMATPQQPLEIHFSSGEWTGGLVVGRLDRASRQVITNFLTESRSATGQQPIVAIGGTPSTLNTVARTLPGTLVFRPATAHRQTPLAAQQKVAAAASDTIVNPGGTPGVPQTGVLSQIRQQGLVEATHHELHGLSKTGYSARLHVVDGTQGHGGTIKPYYGYEHDYKVTNNGYVGTTSTYSWSTNLPGAYRDTRASDPSSILDFTVGSLFTWQLSATKTYTIDTSVAAGAATSSTARLAGQILPNDGGRTAAEAAIGSGCTFATDPTTLATQLGSGNVAWCAGIHGQFAAYSYISLSPFSITYSGSCRRWTLGQGAVNC
jgi:hypothetical protein